MDETGKSPNRAPAQSVHGDAIFVGRRRELETLSAALEDAVAGRGRVVMLSGAPGIGKTRTAREFADLAAGQGAKVLWGWCYEHQGAPPYWPWLQLIRAHVDTAEPGQLQRDMGAGAADISEILPDLTVKLEGLEKPPALDPEQARFRLFFSIANFLKNVSLSQTLVLVLDDLQWADESSLLLFEFLTREIKASSVMVVGGYRDIEVNRSHPLTKTLGILDREEHFQRVKLEGLSRQEVGEFVESMVGTALAEAAVDTLYQRTEGNPLFVGEVVGSVSPEEMAQSQDWTAGIPDVVREAILQRIRRLSQSCNQLLRTASVIGRDFDLPLLRAMIPDLAEDDLLESLDEALGLRIVEPLPGAPGRFRFGHALIQQAVYEEIPLMRQAQAHAAIGEALEHLHQDNLAEYAGELARHFAEAGAVGGTEKMVRYSLIAGERALDAFAYEQALVHYGQVLAAKAGLPIDAESAGALFGLFRAQFATMPRPELGEAYQNLSRAFDYYASVGDTANIVAIAELPLPQLTEFAVMGSRLSARALELVPDDSLEAGRLHCFHGSIQGLTDGDYKSARDSFDRALAIARREGDAALEMQTLTNASQVELWHNRFENSVKSGLAAIELAVAASNQRVEVMARYWVSLALKSLGDMPGLTLQATAILNPASQLRDRNWLAVAHNIAALPLILKGDWHSARVESQQSLDLMPTDTRFLVQRVILEAERGNRRQADDYLEQLEEVVLRSEAGPDTPNAMLAFGSPLVRSIFDAVKRPVLGENSIKAVLSSPLATPFFSNFARAGATLLAVMNDDVEAAAEQYAALKPWAGSMGLSLSVDRALGLLAGIMGDIAAAGAHFDDACAFCRRAGYRPELAWACYGHASAILRLGGPSGRQQATSLLDESLSIATELEMAPLAETVAALQEILASEPTTGPAYPDGLTAREIEVLRLVAAGKSNQEIADALVITLRTAGNHVSNILNKTGLTNRTEAAAYAIRQGIA
ncbi:MAG: AAA family ATPase [Chloroflexi bacterium]|nr:AAA family ATPase [Chloroflexota bacterium]